MIILCHCVFRGTRKCGSQAFKWQRMLTLGRRKRLCSVLSRLSQKTFISFSTWWTTAWLGGGPCCVPMRRTLWQMAVSPVTTKHSKQSRLTQTIFFFSPHRASLRTSFIFFVAWWNCRERTIRMVCEFILYARGHSCFCFVCVTSELWPSCSAGFPALDQYGGRSYYLLSVSIK